MRILLVDWATRGHRVTYLNLFLKGLNDLGFQPHVFSPAAQEDLEGEFSSYHRLEDFHPDYSKGVRKQLLHLWKYLADSIKPLGNTEPMLALFPYVDDLLECYVHHLEIDRLFPYPWAGLYMKPRNFRQKFRYPRLRVGLLDPNEILRAKYLRAIATLDTAAVDWLAQKTGKPAYFIPDTIDTSEPDFEFDGVRTLREKAGGRPIVLAIGFLQRRKGIPQLLSLLDAQPKGTYFVAMVGDLQRGSLTKAENDKIDEYVAAGDIFLWPHRIPDEAKFNAFVATSTVLYACYEGFPFSSNIVTKAAFFRKPVLVSEGGQMAELVTTYNTGEVVPYGDLDTLQQAILRTIDGKYDFDAYNSRFSYDQFLQSLRKLTHRDTFYPAHQASD